MRRAYWALLAIVLLNGALLGGFVVLRQSVPTFQLAGELQGAIEARAHTLAVVLATQAESDKKATLASAAAAFPETRFLIVSRAGTVRYDSNGTLKPQDRITRSELDPARSESVVVAVEEQSSNRNLLYAFAGITDGEVLILTELIPRGAPVTATQMAFFAIATLVEFGAYAITKGYVRSRRARLLEEHLAVSRRHETVQREFLANAAHELRTPVWSIKLFANEMANDPMADELSRYIAPIERASDRISQIVSQLLDLSKMDAGILELNRSYVDVETWLGSIVRMLTPVAQEGGAVITWSGEGSGQAWLDPQLLGQTVTNLIENAVKYGGKGVQIRVSAGRREEDLVLTVVDDGPGIPAEHLPHLFERFYRVDKDRSRKKGGSGLGLAISKGIVELHGGLLLATSAVGVGTTMSVSIPCKGILTVD